MFAVIEDFESAIDPEDKAKTCTTHTETREAAQRDVNAQKMIRWTLAVDIIEYSIIEFKGTCPNCGRSFFY